MSEPTLPNNKKCVNCGCRFDWSWTKCPGCGWQINKPIKNPTTP